MSSLYEVADRVATVTLNRPEARNALSVGGAPAAARAGSSGRRRRRRRRHDPHRRRPGVLRRPRPEGARQPAATAAAAPGRSARTGPTSAPSTAGRAVPAASRKPVIGAINGVAVTGGFEVALDCDFLIASERARFADTHARVGIQPGWGLTVLLPQAVGVRRARELSTTGNFLDAADRAGVGARQPRRRPRRAAPVLPASSPPTSCRNDQAGVQRILRDLRRGRVRHRRRGVAERGRASPAGGCAPAGPTPEDVEARRRAVMERGRAQTSTADSAD